VPAPNLQLPVPRANPQPPFAGERVGEARHPGPSAWRALLFSSAADPPAAEPRAPQPTASLRTRAGSNASRGLSRGFRRRRAEPAYCGLAVCGRAQASSAGIGGAAGQASRRAGLGRSHRVRLISGLRRRCRTRSRSAGRAAGNAGRGAARGAGHARGPPRLPRPGRFGGPPRRRADP
jgi:hypothetical protein